MTDLRIAVSVNATVRRGPIQIKVAEHCVLDTVSPNKRFRHYTI